MRCDMTQEAMVTLVHYGFEIVTDIKNADYTFETTLLSCGNGRNDYYKNRSELPLKERAIYKDFIRWVETKPSEVPKSAFLIAEQIKNNEEVGLRQFAAEQFIWNYGDKFSYTENWQYDMKKDREYLGASKLVVLPNKYYNMPDEDKKILQDLNKKFQVSANANNKLNTGSHMASSGFNMLSSTGFNSGASSAVGGAGAVIGLFMMFGGVTEPDVVNSFKVTNNRTGKSWSQEMHFSIPSQTWRANINKPMDDWLIDEIPWGELE